MRAWPWRDIWNYEQQVYDENWLSQQQFADEARIAGKNASAQERWQQRTGVKYG